VKLNSSVLTVPVLVKNTAERVKSRFY